MKQTGTPPLTLGREEIHRGPLVLVSQAHPIAHSLPAGRLVQLAPGVRLERQAARLYEAAVQDAGAVGQIIPVSGYRSREEQQHLFDDTLRRRGEEYTRTYVALPGCSEHQTGLALDLALAGPDIDPIAPAFPYAGVCQRFRDAAPKYGFIQRYPAGKEQVTGIGHEPWHFRYVGFPHSALAAQLGFTLEEYLQWVQAFPLAGCPYAFGAGGGAFDIGYIPAGGARTHIALPGEPYTLSGDNMGGFVAAVWRKQP